MVVIEQWMSQITLPCSDSRQKRPEKPLMIRHRILSLFFQTLRSRVHRITADVECPSKVQLMRKRNDKEAEESG